MNDEEPKRRAETIELARPYGQFALASLFFAVAAIFMASRASTNDRGLIINGIIHLEADGADVFYGVLAALSAAFVIVGVLGMNALRCRKTFRIVIGKSSVTLPAPIRFWQGRVEEAIKVRYEDLAAVSLSPAGSPALLTLTRRGGPAIHLAKRVVREGWTLGEIAERILQAARADADAKVAKS
jgi:hypothetical protein